MAKKQQRRSQGQGMPVGASIAIIAILVAVAAALSYLAFQNLNDPNPEGFATTNSDTPESSPPSVPAEPTDQDELPAESAIEEAQENQETEIASNQIELVAQSRLIALDGSLGVRAQMGECTSPGSIEFSTDGGQSWAPSVAFDATSATQVLRILPANGGTTFVVALNEECEPQIYSTSTNGATWNGPLSAVGTWYLNPATPSVLGAPGGAKTIGCEAFGLSPVTDREVGVLCADGSILTTADGGTTWSGPVSVDGVIALTYSKQNMLAVANGNQDCFGLQLVNLRTDGDTERVSCVEMDPGSVAAGDIALAESGNALVLWAGENQYISAEGGQTWL